MNTLQKIGWLEPNSILDCGAWLGHWAKEAHAIWPHASIYCIEGNPACEPALKETGFPYKIAMLGEFFTSKTYYKQEGTDLGTGNGLYKENTPFFERCTTEEVDVLPLTALFQEGTVFDFCKLDTQGSEIDILMGGWDILKHCKAILLETSLVNYCDKAPIQEHVIGFMRAKGFTKWEVVENIHHPLPPHGLIQQDLLFTKN